MLQLNACPLEEFVVLKGDFFLEVLPGNIHAAGIYICQVDIGFVC